MVHNLVEGHHAVGRSHGREPQRGNCGDDRAAKEAGDWMLATECWMLNAGCWMRGTGGGRRDAGKLLSFAWRLDLIPSIRPAGVMEYWGDGVMEYWSIGRLEEGEILLPCNGSSLLPN